MFNANVITIVRNTNHVVEIALDDYIFDSGDAVRFAARKMGSTGASILFDSTPETGADFCDMEFTPNMTAGLSAGNYLYEVLVVNSDGTWPAVHDCLLEILPEVVGAGV